MKPVRVARARRWRARRTIAVPDGAAPGAGRGGVERHESRCTRGGWQSRWSSVRRRRDRAAARRTGARAGDPLRCLPLRPQPRRRCVPVLRRRSSSATRRPASSTRSVPTSTGSPSATTSCSRRFRPAAPATGACAASRACASTPARFRPIRLPTAAPGCRAAAQVVFRGVGLGGFAEYVAVSGHRCGEDPGRRPARDRLRGRVAPSRPVSARCSTPPGSKPGASVLVMGLGGIGLSIVQGARVAGAARIIAADPVAARRDAALRPRGDRRDRPRRGRRGGARLRADRHRGRLRVRRRRPRQPRSRPGVAATRSGGTTVCVGAAPLDDAIQHRARGAVHADREEDHRLRAGELQLAARDPAAAGALAKRAVWTSRR